METGSYLLQKINTSVWYLRPEILQVLNGVLNTKFNDGLKVTNLIEGPIKKSANSSIERGVMIIPIHGIMLNRVGGMDALCGSYGYNMLKESLQAANDNSDISKVVLEWDTPGGMSCGCEEMMKEVRLLAERKEVISLCVGQMCSAGYYIGSAANAVYASDPMCQIGSIGCTMTHCDESGKDAQDGLVFTTFYAGKYKNLGNPHSSLTDEAKIEIQDIVDNGYNNFLNAVAVNRNLTVDTLKSLAEGKVYIANKAPSELLDGIKTLDEILMED